MVEKIGQHTHCHICGKAIQIDETLCSDECKQKYQGMLKKRKLWLYLMWALILGTVAIIIGTSYFK
jgi:predicted nucleic acid-binding Zn ribbon protein